MHGRLADGIVSQLVEELRSHSGEPAKQRAILEDPKTQAFLGLVGKQIELGGRGGVTVKNATPVELSIDKLPHDPTDAVNALADGLGLLPRAQAIAVANEYLARLAERFPRRPKGRPSGKQQGEDLYRGNPERVAEFVGALSRLATHLACRYTVESEQVSLSSNTGCLRVRDTASQEVIAESPRVPLMTLVERGSKSGVS